jgi:hypothetical protein
LSDHMELEDLDLDWILFDSYSSFKRRFYKESISFVQRNERT